MLGTLWLLLQLSPHSLIASSNQVDCISDFNPTVDWVYGKLSESTQISFLSDVCSLKREVNQINVSKLFITNGRLQGANIVCISDEIKKPCKLVVADIINSTDPRQTLKNIFGHEEKFNISGPIDESIERLLIRPAEIIYSDQDDSSKTIFIFKSIVSTKNENQLNM